MNNPYYIKPKQSDFTNYYWFKEELKPQEIEKILKDTELLPSKKAETVGQNDDSVRSSVVKWIPQNQTWDWLYERVLKLIEVSNNAMWNFELTNVFDSIQYTEYYANQKGHYDWHIDVGSGDISYRKVSISIQLSKPEEYEGGVFEIWTGGKNYMICEKSYGTAIVFPSFYMHRVTPVTSGVRKSLVLWVGGTPYK